MPEVGQRMERLPGRCWADQLRPPLVVATTKKGLTSQQLSEAVVRIPAAQYRARRARHEVASGADHACLTMAEATIAEP